MSNVLSRVAAVLEVISERGENGLVVTTDAQTVAALLEILERFCSRFAARDADGVMQLFAPDADVAMVTSEEALLRGPDEVRAFLRRYVQGPTTYSWTWDRRGVSAAGTVGWLLAEGTESAAQGDREEKHPYRMSMVCEKRDGRWLLLQVHGSSPHHG
jgi:uncharacterized protein (TIGR02246 family)